MMTDTPAAELSPMEQALVAKAEAERAIAQLELDILAPVKALFEGEPYADMIRKVEYARSQLKAGAVFEQLGHWLAVIGNVPIHLNQRVDQIDALLAPPPPAPESALLNLDQ
jgi:hypothetical protein